MFTDGVWYMATPYTFCREGIESAFRHACQAAGNLLRNGVATYSPIVYTHSIAEHGKIPHSDHGIWLPFDEAMMNAARGLILVEMDGWQDSLGVAHEIAYFLEKGKPVEMCPFPVGNWVPDLTKSPNGGIVEVYRTAGKGS